MPLWLVLALGLAGGAIGTALHIPAGAMIGALVAVAATNLASGYSGRLPPRLTLAGRALLGTVIGSSINRQTVELLGNAVVPAILVAVGLLAVSVGLGFGLSRFIGLDRATAVCSVVPGGMGEMTSVAHDLGADTRVVAALHVLRLIVILLLVPLAVVLLRGLL